MKTIKHIRKLSGLMALALAGFAMSNTALAATSYTITDIGALDNLAGTLAYGINNNGQVVGTDATYAAGGYIVRYPFLYSNGTRTELSQLGVATPGEAYGINDSGQVVGLSKMTGSNDYHAFLYSKGLMVDLGTFSGGRGSIAYGINNSGQVVGWAGTENATSHAFLYSNGVMTDLGTLGGTGSQARGINNNGQVVGHSFTAGNAADHAFLYSNGAMSDLGTLGGDFSFANAINDNGQVVGAARNAFYNSHAFLYSDGAMSDLGTFGGRTSEAFDINSSGQVVGGAYTLYDAEERAFIYNEGILLDLNNLIYPGSGWALKEARGINDLGQIVGIGVISGYSHAFILTPTAVPVPSSAWLLGSGLAGLLGLGRRRRRRH